MDGEPPPSDRLRGGEVDEETRVGLREFIAYLRDLFERKRQRPTDDMISRLVHVEEDSDALDEEVSRGGSFLRGFTRLPVLF